VLWRGRLKQGCKAVEMDGGLYTVRLRCCLYDIMFDEFKVGGMIDVYEWLYMIYVGIFFIYIAINGQARYTIY
jgi:hypothetical protein